MDQSFKEEFKYSHDNPYHERLALFNDFVYRDHEAEEIRGKWNELVFKREAPLTLEIGSGYGHFMLEYCNDNPDVNYVGLDYRFKRSFQLAKKLAGHKHKNFRYLRAKGERIHFLFEENELDNILYFFPDPWPKNRHKKKRLFQKPFLELAHKTLKAGGVFYIKTDHDDYANWMYEIIKDTDLFETKLATFDLYNEHPGHFLTKYQTKFEKIFLKQNINIKAFVLENKK